MADKIKVGILGATGMVGQKYISLLDSHPWFQVSYLAASPASAGKKYGDIFQEREWYMKTPIPKNIGNLVVGNANQVQEAQGKCSFVFSALELKEKAQIRSLEEEYANHDIPVISNCSAHRETPDVPMIIPEINPEHLDIISEQRRSRGWKKGFIVVKPNCSIQSFMTPFYALIKEGYPIHRARVVTMQAISGAGGKIDKKSIEKNIFPYIDGEEEKTTIEPLKIFGKVQGNKIIPEEYPMISTQCNRYDGEDGHLASVELTFRSRQPKLEQVIEIWKSFRALPQELGLPFAPEHPIVYTQDKMRPQPKLDRDNDQGMAVTVGRLESTWIGISFVGLSHNTVRGAAGGAILTAELALSKGYLTK
jgi:aspartate-semialdehyde dehydrogenase